MIGSVMVDRALLEAAYSACLFAAYMAGHMAESDNSEIAAVNAAYEAKYTAASRDLRALLGLE